MIYVRGCDEDGTSVAQQWSMVGDTWIVGCKMPDALVFPEFNKTSPDARHPERTTALGIYEEGCGLDEGPPTPGWGRHHVRMKIGYF